MTEVMQRLAACTDAAAVAVELRASLANFATSEDRKAALDEVVAFLTASEERWIIVTQTLISDLGGDALEHEMELELLDALLIWMTQDVVQKRHEMMDILLQYFQVATSGLGGAGDIRRWLKWGDQVLGVVHQNAQLMDKQGSIEADDGKQQELRSYVVKIATLLMQLRKKVEGSDDTTPNFKTVTFIWKNLAKVATAFGPTLADIVTEGREAATFRVEEVLLAVVESVERSAGQMLRALNESTIKGPDLGVLKYLKLYWRAFQRLVVAFAACLTCELENCVLAVVNVTATLLYAVRHNLVAKASRPGQEMRAMLEQALEMTEKLASGADGTINCEMRANMRTLLWHPTSDMVRAIGQRQPPGVVDTDVKTSIQWSHLLVLTAFAGPSKTSGARDGVSCDDSNRVIEVTQLFARYRECALTDSNSRLIEATELVTDVMLEYLSSFDDIAQLQLILLQETLYPDWMQRTMCWEIWRELLCFCWDETFAVQGLQMLIDITQWADDSAIKPFVLVDGVDEDIFQLIAFVYADLPQSLQDVCMDQVTALIDTISSEGPGHQFDLRVASQFHLMEKLADVQFLRLYNGPMKDEWIAKYLPMCFECCGTILDLLSSKAKASTPKDDSVFGMIRVLDMCLLVLKGVLDDNESQQDDIAELSIILLRMATEALSQLATQSIKISVSQVDKNCARKSVALEKFGSRCIGRATETSLYLLSKLGFMLKSNKNNQCVQVMKDLLTIVESAPNVELNGTMSAIPVIVAQFLNVALFDMQVARDDMAIVWQLLFALFQKLFAATHPMGRLTTQAALLLSATLDALYNLLAHSNIVEWPGVSVSALLAEQLQPFKQFVLMRKLALEEVAKTLEMAQSSTLQSLKRSQNSRCRAFKDRFPDEVAEVCVDSDQNDKDLPAVPTKRSVDNSEASLQKRHKITHFVSLCREIESSLSSIGNDEAAAKILSGKELEDATAVLHKLLTKTITLYP